MIHRLEPPASAGEVDPRAPTVRSSYDAGPAADWSLAVRVLMLSLLAAGLLISSCAAGGSGPGRGDPDPADQTPNP